jgi:outer membrane protein assembly factor BamE (lipoprotein component of BamABCDE complex)
MIKTTNAARACFAILLAITLSACATRMGRDFDSVWAQQIKPGETTKTEVREKLGRPPLIARSLDGETWTYAYYQGRGALAVMDMLGWTDAEDRDQGSQKRLTITFKGDSVAESKYVVELPRLGH